ncbi:hypothetical protein GIB67_016043 [Kingdonia uniflora]|uniref:Uncharacterized protein n=1 Tax=Kingdonia uniflora TaxID=39325 RepID=A0A7J7L1Z7_9MAGN|nr:hypothetical protein GIB67_016043 [Kingdonia uniflora]
MTSLDPTRLSETINKILYDEPFSRLNRLTIKVSWVPPTLGWAKINVDASYCKDKYYNHIGFVIRNAHNSFVAARISSCRFTSSEEGEALAVLGGVKWAREQGLTRGTEWDFGVFSGLEGIEKPDPSIYELALARAGNIAPAEALHIGDSMRKDYTPARSIGMHGLLLDRFKTPDADSWRKSGAPVVPDLVAAQAWLTSEKQSCGDSSSTEDGQVSSFL